MFVCNCMNDSTYCTYFISSLYPYSGIATFVLEIALLGSTESTSLI